MKIIDNPFEPIPRGRVYQIQDGPLAGRRVVFEDGRSLEQFHASGAVYQRTSCGFRVTPFVDPIEVAKAGLTHSQPEAGEHE